MTSTKQTNFTAMRDATREDYQLIGRHSVDFFQGLPERILTHLQLLSGDTGGYAVDRLTHSLQTASRAHRDDRDEEYVVCALLHDIGDVLAPDNHAALAAEVLRPYVSHDNYWLVAKHGIFQGYYFWHHYGEDRNAREKYRGHPCFEKTALFCERWDQTSFDPAYDTLPLEAFEPAVRRIFARQTFQDEKRRD